MCVEENELRLELMEMNHKYEDLEQNFKTMSELIETLTDDWRKSELRARDFEEKLNSEKILHRDHVKALLQQFEEREKEFVLFRSLIFRNKEQNHKNDHFDQFRRDM